MKIELTAKEHEKLIRESIFEVNNDEYKMIDETEEIDDRRKTYICIYERKSDNKKFLVYKEYNNVGYRDYMYNDYQSENYFLYEVEKIKIIRYEWKILN